MLRRLLASAALLAAVLERAPDLRERLESLRRRLQRAAD